MKCRQAKKLLSPYIDDELSDAERAALEEHLESCEACRSELEALKKISESLRGIYREVKAPPDFVDKLMKRIQELEEGKNPHLLQDELPSYRNRWLKVAVAVGLALSVGIGAIQYGRAHTGVLEIWPGFNKLATSQIQVPAEKDAGVSSGTKVGEIEKARVPDKNGSTSTVEQGSVKSELNAAEKQEVAQGSTPVTIEEKKPGNITPEQRAGEQPKSETRVATGQDTGTYQPKVFLSKNRHVRTTMVKLEVADLVSAKAAVAIAAAEAGASGVTELRVYQDKEIILKAVIPSGVSGEFFNRIASLGNVLERKQEILDITAEFNNKVLEYQVLAGKKDEESQVVAKALERYLEDLDSQTLEAGKEVVNVWLKLR